jgi:hypothetical protein
MGAGASAADNVGGSENDAALTAQPTAGYRGPDYNTASEEQKALMVQAQAHWHRMIKHANSADSNNTITPLVPSTSNAGENEEKRVQRIIALYKEAEDATLEELDHKGSSDEVEDDFNRQLESRLAPLDEATLIARSNSDIVLMRSPSGDPLPIMSRPSSSSIKASRSSTSLQHNDVDNTALMSSPKVITTPSSRGNQTSGRSLFSPLSTPPSTTNTTNNNNIKPSPSTATSLKQHHKISPECLQAISLLPPVRVDLRSRTGTSLSLVWDCDMEALICLRKVTDTEGTPIHPRYEVMFRKSQLINDLEVLYDLSIQQDSKASTWQAHKLQDVCSTTGIIDELEPNTLYCVRCRRMQVYTAVTYVN